MREMIVKVIKQPSGTYLAEESKELIRCKDCKNYLQMDCPMGVLHWNAPPKDGYCYKAVKQNDSKS